MDSKRWSFVWSEGQIIAVRSGEEQGRREATNDELWNRYSNKTDLVQKPSGEVTQHINKKKKTYPEWLHNRLKEVKHE